MKYRIIILIITFLTLLNVKAQVKYIEYEFVDNSNSNGDIYYSFELFNNNTYQFLMLYQATGDISVELMISCGKYITTMSKIYLADKYENYTIVLEKRKGYVESKKIFYPLINKKLVYKELVKPKDKQYKPIGRNFIYKGKISQGKLSYGIYINNTDNIYGSDIEHVMKLIKPNKFIYSYNGVVFFKGTYVIQNNKLLLYDTSLRHTFTFYINKNAIVENFFSCGIQLTRLK